MNSFFSRKETTIIKGLCVVFLFVHHFFTFPGWYTNGIYYPSLDKFAEIFSAPFKIPTAVFAFFTGYFFFFGAGKNLLYSLKKIFKIYFGYWVILIPFYIFSVVMHHQEFSVKNLILQLLALDGTTLKFNWYVFFYAVSMLLLPLLVKTAYKHIWSLIVFGIVIPITLCTLDTLYVPNMVIGSAASYFKNFFPCITIGYLFAQRELFQKISKPFDKKSLIWLSVLLGILSIALSMLGRQYFSDVSIPFPWLTEKTGFRLTLSMDMIYAPLFLLGMRSIICRIPDNKVFKILFFPLEKMGAYTLEMWLFSSIFFSCSRDFFQPFLYFPKNAVLVLIWGCAICLIIAVGLKWITNLIGGKLLEKEKSE